MGRCIASHPTPGISLLFIVNLPIILSLCNIVLFFHEHVLLFFLYWMWWGSLFRVLILFVCLLCRIIIIQNFDQLVPHTLSHQSISFHTWHDSHGLALNFRVTVEKCVLYFRNEIFRDQINVARALCYNTLWDWGEHYHLYDSSWFDGILSQFSTFDIHKPCFSEWATN